MPFLPLYVEQLGVTGHSALNMWSGLVFSITFLFSAIASPFWGLADRKGENHAAAFRPRDGHRDDADGNGAEYLAVSAAARIARPAGRFIPNANALIATQIPRHKSGWALGTLSTGAVAAPCSARWQVASADHWGLRTVFFMTAAVLFICFLFTLF